MDGRTDGWTDESVTLAFPIGSANISLKINETRTMFLKFFQGIILGQKYMNYYLRKYTNFGRSYLKTACELSIPFHVKFEYI